MRLPEVTEVERITLNPGDVLFLHVGEKLTAEAAHRIREQFSAAIGRADVKVVVLDRGMTVKAGARAS